MKVDELRVLEGDELGGRLRTARRELYELRFKHAVGQLENSSQISKVRHDIARIMTVLSERELGINQIQEEPSASPLMGEADQEVVSQLGGEVAAQAAEGEAPQPQAAGEPAAKPKRARKAKTEETA